MDSIILPPLTQRSGYRYPVASALLQSAPDWIVSFSRVSFPPSLPRSLPASHSLNLPTPLPSSLLPHSLGFFPFPPFRSGLQPIFSSRLEFQFPTPRSPTGVFLTIQRELPLARGCLLDRKPTRNICFDLRAQNHKVAQCDSNFRRETFDSALPTSFTSPVVSTSPHLGPILDRDPFLIISDIDYAPSRYFLFDSCFGGLQFLFF